MTYEEFICCVRNGMADILGNNVCVKLHKVLKNNDIELDALTILNEKSNVSPTIYLNAYYEEWKNGRDIGDIISEIYQLYEEHSHNLHFDVDIFKDFEKIRGRIAYKLINTKANAKLLEDVPNVPFLDLSVVFYCMLDNDYLGSATALIHKIHQEMWGIRTNELYEIAKRNTPQILQYELRNMNDLIRDILVDDLQKTIYEKDDRYDENCKLPNPEDVADGLMREINQAKEQIAMYVLTNKQRSNGAACMLYENVIGDFAQSMGEDVFILPSSVHEVILVPAIAGIQEEELTRMVQEVNREELDDIDVLADHVYYYSREQKGILTGKDKKKE